MAKLATDSKTLRNARTRKDSTATKRKPAQKNGGSARKNAATARKNGATLQKNGATARKNAGRAQANADGVDNYEGAASNIPVPVFDAVELQPPRRTGRSVDDLAAALDRAEVRLRWAWAERDVLAPALPADFHPTAWTALTALRQNTDDVPVATQNTTADNTSLPDAVEVSAARALETLREKLQVIRGAVEFTTRPGDPERDALRFGTVLRPTRALLRLAPEVLTGARKVQKSFPALTDDVIDAADKALDVARSAVARARRQEVSGSVTRGTAADREQRALDVLLDCVDHLRAAALTRLTSVKPRLAALLMAPIEPSKSTRSDDKAAEPDENRPEAPSDDRPDA